MTTMEIPEGWAEFNEAEAKFRGALVAATGTFSGTLKADTVNAVRELNIRDGSVSTYYGFTPSASAKQVTFTIPGQPYAQAIEVTIPFSLEATATHFTYKLGITITKNGAPFKNFTYTQNCQYSLYSLLSGLKFFDFDDIEESTTYVVSIKDSSNSGSEYYQSKIAGTIIVACRNK